MLLSIELSDPERFLIPRYKDTKCLQNPRNIGSICVSMFIARQDTHEAHVSNTSNIIQHSCAWPTRARPPGRSDTSYHHVTSMSPRCHRLTKLQHRKGKLHGESLQVRVALGNSIRTPRIKHLPSMSAYPLALPTNEGH